MTIRPLQHWFESMSTRERFMLLLFVWVAIFLWGTLLLRQIKGLQSDMNSKNVALQGQKVSLDQQHEVENKINNYNKIFQKSISQAALSSMANTFVAQTGMPRPNISSARVNAQKDSIFNINSITVTFNNVPFLQLMDFISKVLAQKPYLVIDEVTFNPQRLNPTLMGGTMRINSLELKKGALDSAGAPPTTR